MAYSNEADCTKWSSEFATTCDNQKTETKCNDAGEIYCKWDKTKSTCSAQFKCKFASKCVVDDGIVVDDGSNNTTPTNTTPISANNIFVSIGLLTSYLIYFMF